MSSKTPDSTAPKTQGKPQRNEPIWSKEQLEAVARREPEALSIFFERTFDQIYGMAFRLLGERAAAEDAAQEVYLKIHRAAHRIDPNRSPTPWILTITTNVCRDIFRSASHRMGKASVSLDEEPEFGATLVPDRRTPEEDLLAKEREELVQDAIQRLPDPLREVVLLHDYQGLGHQEVAEIVGASYAAVRKRYSRALTALGELLEDRLQ